MLLHATNYKHWVSHGALQYACMNKQDSYWVATTWYVTVLSIIESAMLTMFFCFDLWMAGAPLTSYRCSNIPCIYWLGAVDDVAIEPCYYSLNSSC